MFTACGGGAVSALQAAACTTPNAPNGLIATGADGQVTITWNSVSGVSSYNVYWSTNLSSATALSTMTKIDGIAASPYAHTGRTNNTAYYYRVTSVTGNCESAASALVNATPSATNATTGGGTSTGTGTSVTTAPSAPANVIAAAADGQVTLSWSAASGATSYKVYVGTATGVTTGNATISTITTVTSLTQTGLTNGTTYYFIVTASNSVGESAASSEVSAKPAAAATAPAAPAGVSATAGNTQVTVTWTAVTGATSYTVYYGTSTGVTKANATGSATSTVASLAKTGLTNGTTYYFIVTASNSAGESAASSEVSATPTVVVTASVYADAFTTDNWTEYGCWSTSSTGQSHSIGGGTATVSHSSAWAGSCIKNTNVVVDGTKDWTIEVTITTTAGTYYIGDVSLLSSSAVSPNLVNSRSLRCYPNLRGGALTGMPTAPANSIDNTACGGKPLKLTKVGDTYTWYVNGVSVWTETAVDANLSSTMYPMLLAGTGAVGGSAYFTNFTVTHY